MDFNASMSSVQKAQTALQADAFNKTLAVNGRTANTQLGKDDFLKLLIAQLANQDPTSPMENTEFIAQMAQFSSLEQMTNMSAGFERLSGIMAANEGVSALGRMVEIEDGETSVRGIVTAATRGENPQVQVGGNYYDARKIRKIEAGAAL